ncbi:MarR family transcriptional regulator [Amycolatopsis acidicola]|uniref:MarR family transcriptional regulator n=1 Tax=Amycolatopsis acidicola TaxID=2596893 RepID=A0A5N0UU71_9PSEU|nr:MarR family transcriptional regulator [Amycolatopsis acidicola]KAA9153177.1 MarR family transcriptional regulator [Amycolatopsis acidicola]
MSKPGDEVHAVSTWPAADIAASWRRELPGVPTGSIEIVTPVWRIAKVLADDRRRTLAALGLDPATLDLLSVIRRAGPPYELTTREITERTLVTAGAVSQRVARAERAGWVERAPSTASRRAVAVRLTAEGHRLIESAVRRLLEHEAESIAALSEDERVVFAGLVGKLEGALVPQHGSDTGAV